MNLVFELVTTRRGTGKCTGAALSTSYLSDIHGNVTITHDKDQNATISLLSIPYRHKAHLNVFKR